MSIRLGSFPVVVGPLRLVLSLAWLGWLLATSPLALAETQSGTKSTSVVHRVGSETQAEPAVATNTQQDQALGGSCAQFAALLCNRAGSESKYCKELQSIGVLFSPETCQFARSQIGFTYNKLAQLRAICDNLVTRLCKALGSNTDSCKMVQNQTKSFPPERCQVMLGRYDEVLADLKRMEELHRPLDKAKQRLIAAGDAPGFGPPDARVTVVEFTDFQCPFCARAANVVRKLRAEYGTRIRFVLRQYPLTFHEHAHLAAQAALAAHAQGRFWAYHDKLFTNEGAVNTDPLGDDGARHFKPEKGRARESLERYAAEIGLDLNRFKRDLDDPTFRKRVDADAAMGSEVGVQGTPQIFINGGRVENPTDLDAISQQIDKALGIASSKRGPH